MNYDEKWDVGTGLIYLLLQGAGIGFGIWFASDVGTWAWIMPFMFAAGGASIVYSLWNRVEKIVSRVRVEEIDRHLASLEAIRRAI